jgi:nucleotide-binding universal stress UspA family protein
VRILIAMDGSQEAERAAAAVAGWAVSSKADVCLVSVLHPDEIQPTAAPSGFSHALTPAGSITGTPLNASEPPPRFAEDRSQAIARARSEREDYLRGVGARLLQGANFSVTVGSSADTADEIVRLADELGADLIAMGTHGRSGVSRLVLGSVAERTVRSAHVPVLVVGPAARVP